METIFGPQKLFSSICGWQKPFSGNGRYSRHCLRVPCADGELLFQTMTGELLFLPNGESHDDVREELVRRWFIVPEDFDENALAAQSRHVAALMQDAPRGFRSAVVFTTLDCNARCYYCFELGVKRLSMSEQTAEAAADYLIRKREGDRLDLHWFGGEPLFNRPPIDLITRRLREAGISYESEMISNAYLFDEETVRSAKEDWHLKSVQVTLDGTEEIYNRTKAYIHHEGSAYRRVLRNISLLLDEGIRVSIRLNIDSRNCEDLMRLVDELFENFSGREGFVVYPALLRDYGRPVHGFETEEEKLLSFRQLRESLIEKGLLWRGFLSDKSALISCMADNDASMMILPDGKLGKCEHEMESGFVGSIYDDALDASLIASWKERLRDPACPDCVLAPRCLVLKKCAKYAKGCDPTDRTIKIDQLVDRVLSTYEREKNKTDGSIPGPENAAPSELC